MNLLLIDHEATFRLCIFLIAMLLIGVWEIALPRRHLRYSLAKRWSSNLLLVVIDALMLRILQPLATVTVALYVSQQGWGLLNQVSLPTTLSFIVGFLVLDLVIYGQHRLFHRVQWLWQLHKVHHTDMDMDFTTGVRFHPIEIAISLLIKLVTICLLGPAVVTVIIFEVILNAAAVFNHGNIYLPAKLDRVLRWLIVTPDMHRIHHSIYRKETDSNYGFFVSFWDRLFKTYTHHPKDQYQEMKLGLPTLRDEETCASLPALLKLPFSSNK